MLQQPQDGGERSDNRAEGKAKGSSYPRKGLGLQGCDPVSQALLGEDKEGHTGSKDQGSEACSQGGSTGHPQELPESFQ